MADERSKRRPTGPLWLQTQARRMDVESRKVLNYVAGMDVDEEGIPLVVDQRGPPRTRGQELQALRLAGAQPVGFDAIRYSHLVRGRPVVVFVWTVDRSVWRLTWEPMAPGIMACCLLNTFIRNANSQNPFSLKPSVLQFV